MGDLAEIHAAAIWGDHTTLRRVLAEGVSPDAIEPRFYGRTPLHFLCDSNIIPSLASGLVVCFELLRDAGANLEAVDHNRNTPLHCAARSCTPELLSLLVQARVKLDVTCIGGTTALHQAARMSGGRATECVGLLLAGGADVDARCNTGMSPLSFALDFGCRHTWPLLLRAGAEIPSRVFVITRPYIVRVRNAGGFKKYALDHLTRITPTFASMLRLPAQPARRVAEFWLHAGYY